MPDCQGKICSDEYKRHVAERHARQQPAARQGDRHPLAAEGPDQVVKADDPVEVHQAVGRQIVQHEPAAGVMELPQLAGVGCQRLQIGGCGGNDDDLALVDRLRRIGCRPVLQVDRVQHLGQRRLDRCRRGEEFELVAGAVVQHVKQQRLRGRMVPESLATTNWHRVSKPSLIGIVSSAEFSSDSLHCTSDRARAGV